MAGELVGQVRQQRLPVEVPIANGALQEHQGRTLAVHGRTDGDTVGGGDVVGALVAHALSCVSSGHSKDDTEAFHS